MRLKSKLRMALCFVAPLVGCTGDSTESGSPEQSIPLPGLGARLSIEPIGPLIPARAEGELHALYELRVGGFDPRALRIDSVAVYAGGAMDRALARYAASELDGMVESLGTGDPLLVAPGRESVLFFHVTLSDGPGVPALTHRFWLSSESGGASPGLVLDTGPLASEADHGPLLDPPLRGGPWYAHAGPGNRTHHRRTLAPRAGVLTMDQRFATDWLRLRVDRKGGAQSLGPDWEGTAGEPVHAVADGTVVTVVDGIPDEPIGELGASGLVVDWETISGNRVVVDMGEGHYAWYEHLENGSVGVQEGDPVSKGQVLGRVGNSGNTSHPHLHFAVTDSPVSGQGRGLPYRFRCFGWLSRVAPMPSWDEVAEGDPAEIGLAGPLVPLGTSRFRANEIPLGGAVVDFAEEAIVGCESGSVEQIPVDAQPNGT